MYRSRVMFQQWLNHYLFSTEEIIDYPAVSYIRQNHGRFPPSTVAPPFDAVCVESTIVRLSGLSPWTSFFDLQNWLGDAIGFQGVIQRSGSLSVAYVEVVRPQDVVGLFAAGRRMRGVIPNLTISRYPRS